MHSLLSLCVNVTVKTCCGQRRYCWQKSQLGKVMVTLNVGGDSSVGRGIISGSENAMVSSLERTLTGRFCSLSNGTV